MKHDTTERVRNAEMIKLHKEYAGLTLREIGEVFGISKQRVSWIIKRGY